MKFLSLVLALSLLLAGCGSSSDDGARRHAVATVNGVEIYQEEVDAVLGRLNLPPESEEASRNRRRMVLGDLVRTELMAQAAIADKLDAAVDLELEARMARRQLLASLQEKKAIKDVAPIPPAAARNIVDSNRELFARHQLLTLEEIQFVTTDETLFDRLDAAASRGEGIDRLEALALAAKAKTSRTLRQVGTDQLPPAILKPLQAARPGVAIIVKSSKGRGAALAVRASVSAPIAGENAEKLVTDNMLVKQRRDAVVQDFKKVLDASSIQYFGEFAVNPDATGSSAPALPRSLTNNARHQRMLKASLAVTGAMVVVLLMLTYSFARRWMTGDFWLPRLTFWRPVAFEEMDPVHPDVLPSFGGKLAFLALTGCSFFTIVPVFEAAWLRLPLWSIGLGLCLGVVAGILAIRYLSESRIRIHSRVVRWWPPVLLALLTWMVSAAGLLSLWRFS